jgi:hypothetical protein
MIKLLDILENKILIPRRSAEERTQNHMVAIQKQIQQYIKDGSQGDLDLSGTPIESLPAGLQVVGNLYLSDSKIQSLPAGLRVGGYLYLSGTSIKSLPQGLRVGGGLDLSGTPIARKYSSRQIKDMVPGVRGRIYI